VCFLWLPSVPHFSDTAGVGGIFGVCIPTKVVFVIMKLKAVDSDGPSSIIFIENIVKTWSSSEIATEIF
jgi:hypothetical protein